MRTSSDPRPSSAASRSRHRHQSVPPALADWRAQTKFLVTTAVLSASVMRLILFLIIRRSGAEPHAQQRLEAERQPARHRVNNMIQGLVMYDGLRRIVTANQRYIECSTCRRSREAGCLSTSVQHARIRVSTATSLNSVRGF